MQSLEDIRKSFYTTKKNNTYGEAHIIVNIIIIIIVVLVYCYYSYRVS